MRKLAAFAGAAVLGLSAVAVADVMYSNTQLVDQNGQPTVKIYVGSTAAISDGVAAANIAAKIANEAYKSATLTASVTGTATCAVGAGTSGTGSCSIVESSKKVTLEVQVPGTIAGTHTFKTLITDTIDRTPGNRNDLLPEDVYTATTTGTDTSGSITSPLRAIETGTIKGKDLYRIGSGQFTGFADYSVVDSQSVATTYTEEQSFWVGSRGNNSVAYDSSSSIRDVAVNKYSAMVYSLKFTGNDFGIPVCTGDLNTTSDDWTSCASDSNSRTAKHRVKLKFMGGDWIISSMTQATTALASSSAIINGGEIKLAKEAKYGIINVGQILDAGTFKIRLSDISVAVGATNTHPAIIDVLDAGNEDAVIGQIQVDPGSTYTFTQSGTGNSVKIHVYKTAPGFTLNAKWAELAVYTDEITLKDSSRYNLVSSTDTDKDFKVSLLWKNKDYTGASGGASQVADALREIVIYNIDGFSEKAKPGDVQNFLKSQPSFKLTYSGLDLTDDDYQPLTYTALSSDSYRIASVDGDQICAATSSGDSTYTAKLIEIRASGGNLLGGTGNLIAGNYMLEKVMFDPIGMTGMNSTTIANGTQNQSTSTNSSNEFNTPKVFWKVAGRDCWNWANVTYASTTSATVANSIKFDTSGDNSAAQGMIFFTSRNTQNLTATLGNTFPASIVLQEDVGTYGGLSNNKAWTAAPVLSNDSSTSTMRFRTSDSSTQQAYYLGLANTTGYFTNYEPTLVTERGTKVLSVGTSDASFKVAKKLGHPTFQFAYADTSTATSGEEYQMGVGESKVFGGVTVKVKAIDATAGSCSVLGPGGTPACSVDSTGVSAIITEENAPSVTTSVPFALKSSLVMMDASGPASGPAILVGGPVVNTMTADVLKDSQINLKTDGPLVREFGNKIVVAGYTAEDTMAAAEQFIAAVKRQ